MKEREPQHHHTGKPGSRRGWRLAHGVAPVGAAGVDTKTKSQPARGSLDSVELPTHVLESLQRGDCWTGYLAPEGFVGPLVHELTYPYWPGDVGQTDSSRIHVLGRLVLAQGPQRRVAWAQNVWPNLVLIKIQSVGDAAKQLRVLNRNWSCLPMAIPSRSELIQAALPHVSFKPLVFGGKASFPGLGAFALLDTNTLLACPNCTSVFPHGELHFQEDHVAPPSRAYLKLWELFTRLGRFPSSGQRCVDLGASPGGWTWVLAGMGCEVVAVDKADLAESVRHMPGVFLRQESAFGVDPHTVGTVDWLFSDIICYPQRLLGLVQRWQQAGLVTNWVCSLKLQGETDHDIIRQFAAIPGSELVHLSVNRHELTWCLLAEKVPY